MGKSADEIERNGERMTEAMKRIAEARERLAAIRGGDRDAVTGGKSERERLEGRVETGRSERSASMGEADAAAKKAAEIEKRLVRETRSELENEVSDIRELRDEYKSLISTVLSYEKSKRDKDAEKVADLEGRLAEADATAERRIRVAEEKARRKFDHEVADLQESFDATAEDVASAAQSLRGNQMEQRMLTATQEIAKHTKKTAELLKDGSGGGSTLTFQ